jgi:tRNA A37 threonylcarbamoyladenosine modification protein TsaB
LYLSNFRFRTSSLTYYLKKLTRNSQENKKPSQEEIERAYLKNPGAKTKYVASGL